jgi:tetratricopeptide (TPR) repeat protein/cell division septation protein DedD
MQNLIDDVIRELEKGNYVDAIKYCDQLIESFPDNYIIYEIRGNCMLETGNFIDAIKNYEEAIKKIDPQKEKQKNDLAALFNRKGFAKIKLNDFENAIEDFKQAEKIRPEFPELYNNFANAYRNIEEYKLALDYCGRAIAQKPDFPEVYNNRGNIYYMLSKESEAIDDYTKAIELNPDYAGAYFNRGTTYFYLKNDYDKAKEDWEKAIELNPDFKKDLSEKLKEIENKINPITKVPQVILETDSSNKPEEKTAEPKEEIKVAELITEHIKETEMTAPKETLEDYINQNIAAEEKKKDSGMFEETSLPVPEKPEESNDNDFFEKSLNFHTELTEKSTEEINSENIDLFKDMDDYFKTFETKNSENEIVIPDLNFKDIFTENKEKESVYDSPVTEEFTRRDENIIPEELKQLHKEISEIPAPAMKDSEVKDKKIESITQSEKVPVPDAIKQKVISPEEKESNKKQNPVLIWSLIVLIVVIVGFIIIYQSFYKNTGNEIKETARVDSTVTNQGNQENLLTDSAMNKAGLNEGVKSKDTTLDENITENKNEEVSKENAKEETKENVKEQPADNVKPVTSLIEGRTDLILIHEGNNYFIQVGSFKDRESAETRVTKLQNSNIKSGIKEVDLGDKGKFYRVRVGSFDSKESAVSYAPKIGKE